MLDYDLIEEIVTKFEESSKVLDSYPNDVGDFLIDNKYSESVESVIESLLKLLPPKIKDDIYWYMYDAPQDRKIIEIWGKSYLIKTPKDLIEVMKIMYKDGV